MGVEYRIRKRRKELGLSQNQLAEKLGVHRSYICKIETLNSENMKLPTLIKIADALKVTPQYLMGMDGDDDETHGYIHTKYGYLLDDADLRECMIKVKELPAKDQDIVYKLVESLSTPKANS